MIYAFDEFILDLRRFELSRGAEPILLEPQVFDVLAHLVKNHDRLVTKDELLESVWGDKFVSDAALNSRIMSARKALGDSGKEQRLIRTVHGRGFRFAGQIRELNGAEGAAEPSVADAPEPAGTARAALAPSVAGRPLAREEEIEALHQLLDRAVRGEQQTVFLVGEPGIGKTTLLEAFLSEATQGGSVEVARGQGIQHRGAGEAFMPVFDAVAGICRGPAKDAAIAILLRQAPTWISQMPWLLDPAEHEAVQRRVAGTTSERMLREVAEALGTLAMQKALILALEDLHWSDHSTVDLLAYLARTSAGRRLLVIGTYRPADAQTSGHPVHALAQELSRRREAERLVLGTLPIDAVERYLRRRFLGNVPQDGLAQLLWERAAGNPLYVNAIVDNWSAEGDLTTANGTLVATVPFEALSRSIPPTLELLVEQSFARLERQAQILLEAASVAGRRFTAAEAAAASGVPLEGADTLLAGLAGHGQFLEAAGEEEWQDGTASGRYRFSHEIYQEVLYQRIPAAKRAQLHRAIGDRLETAYGQKADQIAYQLALHFRQGRDDHRARRYLQLSADTALQRAGYQEAIDQLRAAIDLAGRLPEGPERHHEEAVLLTKLATALATTSGFSNREVEHSYVRAYQLAVELGDPSLLSQVAYALGAFHEIRGEYVLSQELMTRRLDSQGEDQTDERVDSYELLACSEFHQGMFESSLQHAERGADLYRPPHHSLLALYGDNPGVACHDWAALSLWFLGFPDRALERARRAMTLAEAPYNFYSLANARVQFAIVHQLRREPAPCLGWADATVSLSTRYGYSYRTAMGTIVGGWAQSAQGKTDEGIARVLEGLELAGATGAEMDHPYFLALLAESYLFAGSPDRAMAAIEAALARMPGNRSFFFEAELHRLRGLALLASSDLTRASQAIEKALAVARSQNARSMELRATMALANLPGSGEVRNRCMAEIRRLYDQFEDGLETPDLVAARRLLDGGDSSA